MNLKKKLEKKMEKLGKEFDEAEKAPLKQQKIMKRAKKIEDRLKELT